MSDQAVMKYDPWGDRDGDTSVWSDMMVTVRKAHTCAICFGPIMIGERVRSRTELFDGCVKTFRFCHLCCDAMAMAGTDDDPGAEVISDRHNLGALRSSGGRAHTAE